MKEMHADRLLKQLRKLDLNVLEQILFMFDLSFEVGKKETFKPVYSKKYFTNYYCIDLETFNKWITIFCPDFPVGEYKKKRKFSNEEAYYIYDCLGKHNFKNNLPRNHKELADLLFKHKNWKKSRRYQEIQPELEEKFGSREIKLNLLPPKLVQSILMEELEDYKENVSEDAHFKYEQNMELFNHMLNVEKKMTEHKRAVRMRYFSILFSKTDEPNF